MSFIGCGILKEDCVWAKVDTWVSAGGIFAKLAVVYPQAIYTCYTSCLQCKWQYLCQVTPDIVPILEPLEHMMWGELLPAFLGVDS